MATVEVVPFFPCVETCVEGTIFEAVVPVLVVAAGAFLPVAYAALTQPTEPSERRTFTQLFVRAITVMRCPCATEVTTGAPSEGEL